MKPFFSVNFPVAPFVVAPNAQLGTEASYVFGPLELTAAPSGVRTLLFDPARDGEVLSTVFGQLFRSGAAVVATCTIKTATRDPTTGRPGQELGIRHPRKATCFSKSWLGPFHWLHPAL